MTYMCVGRQTESMCCALQSRTLNLDIGKAGLLAVPNSHKWGELCIDIGTHRRSQTGTAWHAARRKPLYRQINH